MPSVICARARGSFSFAECVSSSVGAVQKYQISSWKPMLSSLLLALSNVPFYCEVSP
jgi:hypothetical protein